MGSDGRRYGEVVLTLLLDDGEKVMARAHLDSDQYIIADKAHMADNEFVLIKGRLHPGRQPRSLSDIISFNILDPDNASVLPGGSG